ncbi:LADA_0C12376g1_1 [Lachancea dasiensis]|uniref:LADA_0C12376g1_1 n=1 Tax=Lachancea dasiensis TaxID=1072105 RepID=A0A1G4J2D6_9SACH|nr:LADA_0C12376g1_1 [Lachancea dasiensis]
MESPRLPQRDQDLASYLARVEELDYERNKRRQSINGMRNVTSKYRPEDAEAAHRLLSGQYVPSTEKYIGASERASEMAYKSAYNYERTFSPKRRGHDSTSPIRRDLPGSGLDTNSVVKYSDPASDHRESSKQYTISEEDYLLLVKLKQGLIEATPGESATRSIPSRGQPRSIRSHQSEPVDDIDSPPPPLPARQNSELKSTSKHAPTKPPRPEKMKVSHSQKEGTDMLPTLKGGPEQSADLLMADGRRTADYVGQDQNNRSSRASERNNNNKLLPIHKGDKPISYMASLQNNAATETTKPKSSLPVPPPKLTRPPQTFMSSALKKESSVSSPNVKSPIIPSQRKTLPEKSQAKPEFDNFKGKLKHVDMGQGGNGIDFNASSGKMVGELRVPKLRKALPSEVKGVKQGTEHLDIPQLRKALPEKNILSSEHQQRVGKGGSTLHEALPEQNLASKGKENLKPTLPAPQRKATIPEAVGKREKLSKAPPKPERKVSMPEAFSKRASLVKAPPKPSRKVSMPEAMKRLEAMKLKDKSGNKSFEEDRTVPPRIGKEAQLDAGEDLEAMLMAKKLVHRGKSKTFPNPSLDDRKPIPIPFMDQTNNAQIAKLLKPASTSGSIENNNQQSDTLVHLTKSRARGPKRKPPKQL